MKIGLLVLLVLRAGVAVAQTPSYSDSDDSEFKVGAKNGARRASAIFKQYSRVRFPKGTSLYSNLKDLRYYEGPETTAEERLDFVFKNTFPVSNGSSGSIGAIADYIDSSGKKRKAYRVLVFKNGSQRSIEGWCTEFLMTR